MVSRGRSGTQGFREQGAILAPKRSVWPGILTSGALCPTGGFGCVANTGLRNGAESNPNFKLGSRKCASRETFCLVSARLCQPFTIPVIDRLPFDTPSGPGSATYVRNCCAHSGPLSYRGERIWRQRGRGTVRIEDPDFSSAVIVD